MRLECLEGRECPAVRFLCDFSQGGPFFTPEARATIQRAADGVGARLGVEATITLTFTATQQGDAVLARGGPTGPGTGAITFDFDTPWHFGTTLAGIAPNQYDLYTVTIHELGHVLGIGTRDGWADGPRQRGVATHPDGFHFADTVDSVMHGVGPGQRRTFTRVDRDALRDLGWAPIEAPSRGFSTVSLYDSTTGLCRLFVVLDSGSVFDTGIRLPFHIALRDFDLDGSQDLTVVPPLGGPGATFSGTDLSVLDGPTFYNTAPIVVERY